MAKRFAVIGLGHFGHELAIGLTEKGSEVLAIDSSLDRLEEIKDKVTHTVRLDATDEKALRNQGIEDFDAVVVAIGDDFEATLLTVAVLQQIGIKRIIVRGTTPVHERILDHLEIAEIILPEVEAARRLADSLVLESVLDTFSVSSDHAIVEAPAPETLIGKSLRELRLPQEYHVSLVTIKRARRQPGLLGMRTKTVEVIVGIPTAETVIERGDILLVFGSRKAIERMLKT